MKKHRFFLISYSLWLGVIILLLTIFNTPQVKNTIVTSQSISVCTTTTNATKLAECNKCQVKLCCASDASIFDNSEEDL